MFTNKKNEIPGISGNNAFAEKRLVFMGAPKQETPPAAKEKKPAVTEKMPTLDAIAEKLNKNPSNPGVKFNANLDTNLDDMATVLELTDDQKTRFKQEQKEAINDSLRRQGFDPIVTPDTYWGMLGGGSITPPIERVTIKDGNFAFFRKGKDETDKILGSLRLKAGNRGTPVNVEPGKEPGKKEPSQTLTIAVDEPGKKEATSEAKPAIQSAISEGEKRRAAAAGQKERIDALERNGRYGDGVKSFRDNTDFEISNTLLALLDDPAKWAEAWETPGAIRGLEQLKGVILNEPIFSAVKNEPEKIRTLLRKAITGESILNSDKYISFKDLVNELMKSGGFRAPSLSSSVESTQSRLDAIAHRYPSLLKAEDAPRISNLKKSHPNHVKAIDYATGFARALNSNSQGVTDVYMYKVDNDDGNNSVDLTVKFEGNAYIVTVLENGQINIFGYPSARPYAEGHKGYDNSKKFDEEQLVLNIGKDDDAKEKRSKTMDFNKGQKEIAAWFKDAVTPPLTYSEVKDNFNEYFDENGRPKAILGNRPDLVKYYQDLMIGGQRLLEATRFLEHRPEAVAETANTGTTQLLRQAQVPSVVTNSTDAWNADEVVNLASKGNGVLALRPIAFASLGNHAGLQIEDGVLGPEYSSQVQNNKPLLFKLLFQSHSINELLSFGYVKKMAGTGGKDSYVITTFPPNMVRYLTFKGPRNASTNLEIFIRNPQANLSESAALDYIRPQNRLEGVVSDIANPEETEFRRADSFGNMYDQLRTVDEGKYEKAARMTDGFSKKLGPDFEVNYLGHIAKRGIYGPSIKLAIKTPKHGIVTAYICHKTGFGPNAVEIINPRGESEYNMHTEGTFTDPDNGPDNHVRTEFLASCEKLGLRERTWHDVAEDAAKYDGVKESPLLRTMNSVFAKAELNKLLRERGVIDERGQYSEAKLYDTLKYLAEKGYSQKMDILTKASADSDKNTSPDLTQRSNAFDATLGIEPGKDIKNINFTLADLYNPTKGPLLMELIQRGLVEHIAQKEIDRKADIKEKLDKAYKEFEADKKEGLQKALEAIRKAYEKAGKEPPPNLEYTFKEEVFPLMFALGFDVNSGTLGLGVGAVFPIDLPGGAGKIIIGGGAGVGVGPNSPKLGIGAFAAYETPKWGRFSLIVGGGAGVELTEMKLGAFYGGALNIDLGGRRFNHKITAGVAMLGGVMPLPSLLFSYSPDHAYRKEEAMDDAMQAFDLTAENPSIEQINQKPWIRSAILQKHKADLQKKFPGKNITEIPSLDLLKALGPETVANDYKAMRRQMAVEINRKYDPSPADPGATFGIGYDFENDRFVLGYMPNFVNYSEKKVSVSETKSRSSREAEIMAEQNLQILERIRKGEQIPEAEIKKLEQAGAVLRLAGGALGVTRPREQVQVSERPRNNVEGIAGLENELNAMYRPLGLRVKFDRGLGLFELSFLDWNQPAPTNYEIAIDPYMQKGGLMMRDGRLYITSNFEKNNLFTIRRSDYAYPFKYQGADFHTLVTISDVPTTSPAEIYRNSRFVLRSTCGQAWQEGEGLSGNGRNLFAQSAKDRQKYRLSNDMFKPAETGVPPPDAAQETQLFQNPDSPYKKTTVAVEKISGERASQIKDFVAKIMGPDGRTGKFALEYRKLSNAETNTRNYEKLTARINEQWKEINPNAAPLSSEELNLTLNTLADTSFSELDNVWYVKAAKRKYDSNPDNAEYKKAYEDARTKAFEARLDSTKKALTRQFKAMVDENHRHHPGTNDPQRILRSAEEIANITVERAKTVKVNNPNQKPIAEVDRFLSLAATLSQEGLRGSSYTEFANDPLYALIPHDPPVDYMNIAKSAPESYEADLVRLAMEGMSPIVNEKLIFNADDKVENFAEAKNFLNSELSLQIFSMMNDPKAGLMFSAPSFRYEIAKMMGARDSAEKLQQVITAGKPNTELALLQLHNIVTGIREAELRGEKNYVSYYNPNFIFHLDTKVEDGVYRRCTNYTMWITEHISAEVKIPSVPPPNYAGFAAYGHSTATVAETSALQSATIFRVGVGVSAGPPAPKPETPEEHTGHTNPEPPQSDAPGVDLSGGRKFGVARQKPVETGTAGE